MIEGVCPKCGACYYGWSLRFPRNQMCTDCGAALKIFEDGQHISDGYSPFTAAKYSINLSADATASRDRPKDALAQDN